MNEPATMPQNQRVTTDQFVGCDASCETLPIHHTEVLAHV